MVVGIVEFRLSLTQIQLSADIALKRRKEIIVVGLGRGVLPDPADCLVLRWEGWYFSAVSLLLQ